jgi:hypothetical protein
VGAARTPTSAELAPGRAALEGVAVAAPDASGGACAGAAGGWYVPLRMDRVVLPAGPLGGRAAAVAEPGAGPPAPNSGRPLVGPALPGLVYAALCPADATPAGSLPALLVLVLPVRRLAALTAW